MRFRALGVLPAVASDEAASVMRVLGHRVVDDEGVRLVFAGLRCARIPPKTILSAEDLLRLLDDTGTRIHDFLDALGSLSSHGGSI